MCCVIPITGEPAAAGASTHLGNNQRTGCADAAVPAAPVLQWTYNEKHPPRRAWKEPNRELQYIDFDYATQTTIADGNSDSDRQIEQPIVIPTVDPSVSRQAASIVEIGGVRAGYALMLGAGNGQLLCELANRSDLVIYCLEPDKTKVERVRKMLDEAGLLGVRAAVHQGAFDELPYSPYFANLIVWGAELGSGIERVNASEVYRVLRPYGGIALQLGGDDSLAATRRFLSDGGVPDEEISESSVGRLIKRGRLPEAGQWTHAHANIGRTGCSQDTLVRLPLGMLWWGGPGPARIVSRHWRAPSPVFSNGI